MRKYKLCHRATYMFVTNEKHEFLLTKRAETMDFLPGATDLCIRAIQNPDYTPILNAQLKLECDFDLIKEAYEIRTIGEQFYEDEETSVWATVFHVKLNWDGSPDSNNPIRFNEDEIEKLKFMEKSELLEAVANDLDWEKQE